MVVVAPVAVLLVALAVGIHYEALRAVSGLASRGAGPRRRRLVLVILGAIAAHLVEIWVFAIGLYLLSGVESTGAIRGDFAPGFLDYTYFSAVTYTSLGYGDLTPVGPLRLLASLEAITGLVLLAWTASFTFLQMRRLWGEA